MINLIDIIIMIIVPGFIISTTHKHITGMSLFDSDGKNKAISYVIILVITLSGSYLTFSGLGPLSHFTASSPRPETGAKNFETKTPPSQPIIVKEINSSNGNANNVGGSGNTIIMGSGR